MPRHAHSDQFDPAEALAQLTHPDAATRLLGAKWVNKHAHGEVLVWTEPWLKAKGTTDRLLPLLDDPDERVVEEVLGAISAIVWRYRKDRRPVRRAVELLGSGRVLTRMRAVFLLTQFDNERLADALLAAFADPDKNVRRVAIEEIRAPATAWSAPTRERVRQAALLRLADRTTDVRCSAAMLLATVGTAGDVKTLKRVLKGIRGANYRLLFREHISELEERVGAG